MDIEFPEFQAVFDLEENEDLGIEEGYLLSYTKAEDHNGGGFYFETTKDITKALKVSKEEIQDFKDNILTDLEYQTVPYIELSKETFEKIMEEK